jgi:hypothetical protein
MTPRSAASATVPLLALLALSFLDLGLLGGAIGAALGAGVRCFGM